MEHIETNKENGTWDGYYFSEANYNAGKCGSGHNLTGNIPQGNATYDAATANMEAPWKMPTKAQFEELTSNTTRQWTTINGVVGMKFTNKSNSSKYIFLPTAGNWDNATHTYEELHCYCWSSTWSSSTYAWGVVFDSGSVSMYGYKCRYGMSIRPIKYQ